MTEETVTVPADLYLNSEELLLVNLNSEVIKNIEKDKLILDLKKKLLDLQSALITSQSEVIKRDRIIMGIEEGRVEESLQDVKNSSRVDLEEISTNHKELDGKKWGYNPETGEIVINEESKTTS